jgi:quercetin dioxygenase-like cupin family protein
MSTQLSTNNTEERNHDRQRLTADGTLIEFLASSDETGSDICLIRGTMPPGRLAPLHSHADVELFYVLEGSLECLQSRNGTARWRTVGAGDVVAIPGNIKHAWRNSSPLPATVVVVTTSKMYKFLYEVTKPFDPDQSATPPTSEGIQEVIRAAVRYGYWTGSPEDNRAIGINIG